MAKTKISSKQKCNKPALNDAGSKKTGSKKERRPPLEKRLLPVDFRKYLALCDTQKVIDDASPGEKRGFFQFPKQLMGMQDIHIRDFLVFYFDDKAGYEDVKRFFEVPSKAWAHPILDEKKLISVVREKMKEESQ